MSNHNMKKNKFVFTIFLMLTYFISYAQLGDIAKIDYTNIPGSNTKTGYNRTRVLFNYPIKLKKESSYLFLGLDYSNIKLVMDENFPFNDKELEDFQLLDINIGYTQLLKNDWRLGARLTPGLSSNLTAKKLSIKDIVLSSVLVFIKDKTKDSNIKKPWRIIWGVSYSGNRGFPIPLPFISYFKKFSENWSYNIGIPKTNLQYHLAKKHRLKLFAEIDGFTVNLQRGVLIDNATVAESINMSLILGGLQYEYHISKHIQFFARTAYIIDDSVNFRDKDRDNIKELGSTKKLYLKTGIRLKI